MKAHGIPLGALRAIVELAEHVQALGGVPVLHAELIKDARRILARPENCLCRCHDDAELRRLSGAEPARHAPSECGCVQ